MRTASYQMAVSQAARGSDRVLWACAIAAVVLGILAVAQDQQPAAQMQFAPGEFEFPTMAPPTAEAESFQAINDGRVPPGEAIIGANEIRPQQNCPNGQCPLTYTSYQPNVYQPSSLPAPSVVYPAGYATPTYSDGGQYYSQGDCDCENCNCRGRFPIARAGVRVAARVATAPFRLIRAIRARRCCN